MFPSNSIRYDQPTGMHLQRTLSSLETWGFGFTVLLAWLSTVPAMLATIGGLQTMLIVIPGAIIGSLLNLQVKRLGEENPDVVGGSPAYVARLLQQYPVLGRYAAMGYFHGVGLFSICQCCCVNRLD